MFRIAFFASLIFLAIAAASAQTLPRLTITALSITSDRVAAPEGVAFHLRIHVHAKQKNADLSSLVLPDVVNLTILGDEKRTAPASDGTDYIEILTVAGVSPGEATVSPAYIDASDPTRADKPFRFSSNRLRLRITAAPGTDLHPLENAVWKTGRIALAVVAGLIVLGIVAFALVRAGAVMARRKTYVTLPQARPVTQPAAAPVDRMAAVRHAALQLAASRARAEAAALRGALFALSGARRDETLAALLERIPADKRALRGALRAAERATFVNEAHLQGAIDELLDAVRAVVSA